MIKKQTAVFTAITLFVLTFAFAFTAGAKSALITPYSLDDGIEKLRTQFSRGAVGEMDYNYFVPCSEKQDTNEYPLLVICSGIAEGYQADQPVNRHYFANFSSLEFQRRFSAGGAYIMLPRSPQDHGNFWYPSTVPMLKACIDDFVKKHNVDPTRIYLGGFSIGGRMVYQMVDAYPNFFAAALLMSPYTNPTSAEIDVLSTLPVWLFGSSTDTLVNYTVSFKGVWNELIAKHKDPASCRFSTFTYTLDPTGKRITNNHETWHSFTCDMFYNGDQAWPYCSTVDGTGKTVKMTYPNGAIRWLNSCVREDADSSTRGRVRANFFTKLLAFFRRLLNALTGLFR